MVVVEKDEAKGENRETNVDENYEIRYVDNVAWGFLFFIFEPEFHVSNLISIQLH